MSGSPIDRDLGPAHNFGSHAHVHGQSHMRTAAARSNFNNTTSDEGVFYQKPADRLPSQAWSHRSTFASTNSIAHDTLLMDNVPKKVSSTHTQPGGTTSEHHPVTRPAGSAARTRIFDPARDLNPTHPPDAVNPPPSPCSISSTSESSRKALSQSDHSPMGQLFSTCLPASSAPPSAAMCQGPPPEVGSRYELEVIEHPVCARASTYGDRDRRLISPPPILKLSLRDYNHNDPEDLRRLTWAYNIVHCTLWRTPNADAPSSEWVEVTEFMGRGNKPQLGLMGTLVANPFIVDAPANEHHAEPATPPECFYVFSDLSCRVTGLYRLRFGLTKIGDDFYKQVGARSPTIAYTWTNAFEVFSAKDFPGMRPSSQLLRYLKLNGASVTIKKEGPANAAAKKRSRTGSSQGSGDIMAMDVDTKRSKQLTESQYDSEERTPMAANFPDPFEPDD